MWLSPAAQGRGTKCRPDGKAPRTATQAGGAQLAVSRDVDASASGASVSVAWTDASSGAWWWRSPDACACQPAASRGRGVAWNARIENHDPLARRLPWPARSAARTRSGDTAGVPACQTGESTCPVGAAACGPGSDRVPPCECAWPWLRIINTSVDCNGSSSTSAQASHRQQAWRAYGDGGSEGCTGMRGSRMDTRWRGIRFCGTRGRQTLTKVR